MPELTPRMSPGEFQTIREYMGLTTANLAGLLGVREDTVRAWERGDPPIPYRVRDELTQLETQVTGTVNDLVTALRTMPEPAVTVYRKDTELWADRPDAVHLSARWWRQVVARAREQVPDLRIDSRKD